MGEKADLATPITAATGMREETNLWGKQFGDGEVVYEGDLHTQYLCGMESKLHTYEQLLAEQHKSCQEVDSLIGKGVFSVIAEDSRRGRILECCVSSGRVLAAGVKGVGAREVGVRSAHAFG